MVVGQNGPHGLIVPQNARLVLERELALVPIQHHWVEGAYVMANQAFHLNVGVGFVIQVSYFH